ncbi:histidine kinase [Nonomuraea sp. NPDC005983]|uniref:sensor histidine kinase n=1 Tax=Nonomuraea sp. NPDC005983 TaxID=3155595 RepID=UPI0033A8EDFE
MTKPADRASGSERLGPQSGLLLMRALPGLDVTAAVMLSAFMVAVSAEARVVQPEARPMTALGAALLVLSGSALAARRVAPLLSFSLAVGAAAAFLGMRFAGWPVYLGAFAGLGVLVSQVSRARVWVPLAAVGGGVIAVATGPPEGWHLGRMLAVAGVWTVVAVVAARWAHTRRRLAEQEAEARVVRERLRIARELHDVLSHSLASISLQAGVGLHLVDQQPEQAREALRGIRQISTDALAQARAALAVVRQPGEEAAPGVADLEELLASARAGGLSVDADIAVDGLAVPDVIGSTAYRVVQEALTNVMRHAGDGVHARVHLRGVGDWLEIDVTDDGVAALGPVGPPGHGLRGMAERVSAVGGEMRAGAETGVGFALHARLPLGGAE